MGGRLHPESPAGIDRNTQRIVQNTDDASIVKAFGGIEIVLWDIRGKVWNQPLYQHLSNLMRNGRNLDEIK